MVEITKFISQSMVNITHVLHWHACNHKIHFTKSAKCYIYFRLELLKPQNIVIITHVFSLKCLKEQSLFHKLA